MTLYISPFCPCAVAKLCCDATKSGRILFGRLEQPTATARCSTYFVSPERARPDGLLAYTDRAWFDLRKGLQPADYTEPAPDLAEGKGANIG